MNISKVMARRWLSGLIDDCGLIEVRINTGRRWIGGWFDDVDAISKVAGQYPICNQYTSINRAAGVTATNQIDDQPCITNKMVTEVFRLFFDFDPHRPTGQPANATELDMAKQRAKGFMADMAAQGLPQPAFGVSGNGAHVMYRCGFTDLEEFAKYYLRLYDVLAERYSDDAVSMDSKVSNPGRITRLYGTFNRKGESTEERPHRLASIWVPDSYDRVPASVLWSLMEREGVTKEPERQDRYNNYGEPRTFNGAGDYRTLDVVGWFESKGMYLRHIKDNLHAVRCPWANSHTSDNYNDCTVYESDPQTWPSFACKHDHCSRQGITEVMELFGDADAFCSHQYGGSRS